MLHEQRDSYPSDLQHRRQVLAPSHEDTQILQVQLTQAEHDLLLLVAQVDGPDLQQHGQPRRRRQPICERAV